MIYKLDMVVNPCTASTTRRGHPDIMLTLAINPFLVPVMSVVPLAVPQDRAVLVVADGVVLPLERLTVVVDREPIATMKVMEGASAVRGGYPLVVRDLERG